MNTVCTTIKPDYMRTTTSMPPTRVCTVCGETEFERYGSYYSQDIFWLCPDCLKKLRKLLDKSTES